MLFRGKRHGWTTKVRQTGRLLLPASSRHELGEGHRTDAEGLDLEGAPRRVRRPWQTYVGAEFQDEEGLRSGPGGEVGIQQ